MKFNITRSAVAASLVLGLSTLVVNPVLAQSSPVSRAQVKMDRDTFLSMARWDSATSNWVLRDDVVMPAGIASRDEIKAMRDKFLSMNKWDHVSGQYVPVQGAPRDMSKLTRAEVKTETERFLKMYRFDESKSDWMLKTR